MPRKRAEEAVQKVSEFTLAAPASVVDLFPDDPDDVDKFCLLSRETRMQGNRYLEDMHIFNELHATCKVAAIAAGSVFQSKPKKRMGRKPEDDDGVLTPIQRKAASAYKAFHTCGGIAEKIGSGDEPDDWADDSPAQRAGNFSKTAQQVSGQFFSYWAFGTKSATNPDLAKQASTAALQSADDSHAAYHKSIKELGSGIADGNVGSLLHAACAADAAELVRLLLARGADPTCVDKNGMTALQLAEAGSEQGGVCYPHTACMALVQQHVHVPDTDSLLQMLESEPASDGSAGLLVYEGGRYWEGGRLDSPNMQAYREAIAAVAEQRAAQHHADMDLRNAASVAAQASAKEQSGKAKLAREAQGRATAAAAVTEAKEALRDQAFRDATAADVVFSVALPAVHQEFKQVHLQRLLPPGLHAKYKRMPAPPSDDSDPGAGDSHAFVSLQASVGVRGLLMQLAGVPKPVLKAVKSAISAEALAAAGMAPAKEGKKKQGRFKGPYPPFQKLSFGPVFLHPDADVMSTRDRR
jgi:hypothetical protein